MIVTHNVVPLVGRSTLRLLTYSVIYPQRDLQQNG